MKLTFDQIKEITFGALRIDAMEDGIHFHKCTTNQELAMAKLNAGLGERTLTTTGVRLDFHTNSKHLSFATASGKKFEVLIDGILRRQFDCDALREAGEPATFDLLDSLGREVESARVTLVFPSHTVGVLEWIELDDGATLTPHSFDTKILFVGDSITQGWNSDYDSLSYAWRVTSFFNAESVIQGVGGSYFHESTFDSIDFDPDTVIVALGTNDFNHYKTQEDARAHAAAHLACLAKEYAGKRLLAISPIWRAEQNKTMGSFAELRALLIEEIERAGFRHIDGLALVPPLSVLMKDFTLHPDDLGFSLMAENLIAKMI